MFFLINFSQFLEFRYPLVFELIDEGGGRVWFRFTDMADKQYLKERQIRDLMEPILVDKVKTLTHFLLLFGIFDLFFSRSDEIRFSSKQMTSNNLVFINLN